MAQLYNLPFKGQNKITSHFGNRTLNGRKEFHKGFDIVGVDVPNVLAVADGKIALSTIVINHSDLTWEWGNFVKLTDNLGYNWFTCHMSSRAVSKGQTVSQGTKLGVMGNTGYSFGAHTHTEVRQGSTSVNPGEFFGLADLATVIYDSTLMDAAAIGYLTCTQSSYRWRLGAGINNSLYIPSATGQNMYCRKDVIYRVYNTAIVDDVMWCQITPPPSCITSGSAPECWVSSECGNYEASNDRPVHDKPEPESKPSKVYGVDVSKYQGAVNWSQMASELKRVNNGYDGFAIIRVGYSFRSGMGGLNIDERFWDNLEGCEANGVPKGIYWYCYDKTPDAAAATARAVVEVIRGHKFEYPIYIDMEYGTHDGSTTGYKYDNIANKDNNTAMLKAALTVLEEAGYYAGIYCSRNFFTTYTNLNELRAYDKWEAAYVSSDTDDVENGMWQYSSKNALGIAGFGQSLDCDVAYKDYPSLMVSAQLNGYTNEETPVEPEETVDWDSDCNDFIVTATKGDRKALREFCESLQLPVRNYIEGE